MKLRVLISLLFIIATTFASVHETEHIMHDHGSAECEVCIVSQNLLSDDVNSNSDEFSLLFHDKIVFTQKSSYRYKLITTNYANAPPKLS
ncbi:MAG: hypothetical protein ABFQ64_02540 [Campylobacterota bacterium]